MIFYCLMGIKAYSQQLVSKRIVSKPSPSPLSPPFCAWSFNLHLLSFSSMSFTHLLPSPSWLLFSHCSPSPTSSPLCLSPSHLSRFLFSRFSLGVARESRTKNEEHRGGGGACNPKPSERHLIYAKIGGYRALKAWLLKWGFRQLAI